MTRRKRHATGVAKTPLSKEIEAHRDPASFRRWLAICLTISVTSLWYAIVSSATIVQAELALGRGDAVQALAFANQVLRIDPHSDRALTVAGSASLAMQDVAWAQIFFEQVTDRDPRLSSVAQRELGRIALNAGQPVRAEELFRQSLQSAPGDTLTQDQLIYLLTLEGRGWEARALILDRLRAGMVSVNYLVVASKPERGLELSSQFAQHCLSVVPNESLPRLVLAQQAWRDNQPQRALEEIRQVLEKHPTLLEAHALQCQVIAETGTSDDFERINEQLPPTAQTHPGIWLGMGIWAEHQGQAEAAARCYWESLRLNPNQANSNYRLSQALVTLGQHDAARPFAERAQQLTKLGLEMTPLSNKLDLETLPSIIAQLGSLGRDWEAAGWCQLALQKKGPRPAWAHSAQLRMSHRLLNSASYTNPSLDPAHQIDLSHYRLPTFRGVSRLHVPSLENTGPQANITFRDDSNPAGIEFTYRNGASQGHQESMLEMNGGGVAVLDFDGDLWPDLYLTQGGTLPPAPFDPTQSDQLFRNRGRDVAGATNDKPFLNVTAAARLRDIGYGQGVTVGDIDNDGFPDLYVGNIGANQLLHNNGDGTFSDITVASGTQAGGWTSSCVLADFNQDGLPDLYVVTYLGGETPFTPCDKRVRPRCSPLNYPAEPDRFYLNLGDGHFRDLTESHGLAAPEGRGLGVVAADFDNTRRLSLFVGNDMSANFFFVNHTAAPDKIQFEEQALLSGLALDHLGQAKACMGIAAGDYNQDARLDLFVTNFYRQSNDLYTQQPDGTFRDLSREAKLFEPSFLMLGWGTQFLDCDLDGHPDLIVTNGHVHDPVDLTIPYYMPAQVFRNLGQGTFTEIPGQKLGEFFERKLLGRSLARIDWNRDGREDVCISHLNDPVTLLTNRTVGTGNTLVLRLVAVNSARDAIGAKVRVSIDNQIRHQQLTAGDGFQASNERRLIFGLGPHKIIDSVEVLWPSGVRQEFRNLPLNREWLLIERKTPIQVSASASNTDL
ncbi:MAG: putative system TPR-repeat lipoprotein [Planctomycetaceae bacterium]|nr:putative system TPR-repeat lipoprotein [Planctomycetaceae bacterium]